MNTTSRDAAVLEYRQRLTAAASRFWEKVVADGECLRWTGARTSRGYGNFHIDRRGEPRNESAHRVAFVLTTGTVPSAGQYLLHSCDHPWCVNPAHLRADTPSENLRDAYRRNRLATPNARKVVCKRGHPFDEANTIVRKDGSRACRACQRTGTVA